ncbi:hypothetical protein HRI_000256200 [Hibiscus trionum]|uniref:Protein kinase domain-containing protein n=1 Tax=Hibiscus trionum TaxID=183268 RepID=A0A9W7LIY4_HIBTR|nr:hypothetical protein HRI_000256200 [Hibiscus trionum]
MFATSCKCFGSFDWFKGRNSLAPGRTQAQEFTSENIRLFTYNSLRSATSNFHPINRIGGGGFGVAYRVKKALRPSFRYRASTSAGN